jgi:hypothetical protein
MTRTCTATRADGRPCQTPVVGDGPFCFGHDPALAAKRDAARRRGGANRSNARRLERLMPLRLKPIFGRLETALKDVLAGDLDPRAASAAANVARALVALQQAGEMEARLRALEERRYERPEHSA